MKKLGLTSMLLALVCLCLGSTTTFAQSEKISIRIVPKPNQTSHLSLSQDGEIEMSFEGNVPEELAKMNPMRIKMKTLTSMTVRSGAPDNRGQLEVEMSYDKSSVEMTMNGNPVPGGNEADKLIGKKFKVVYDRQGNLVDVKIPPGLGLPSESFKEMLKSIYGNLPTAPMAVGETAIVPFKTTFPMPIPGAGPLNLEGQAITKLVAVNKGVAARIARFDQITDAKLVVNSLDAPGPDGQRVKMNLDFKMSGFGTYQMNLDKGMVKSGDMQMKIEGRITSSQSSAQSKMPNINVKGTIKVAVTGGN